MMALIRFGVTSRAAASSFVLSCIGSMYSSRKTLPGCIRALTRAMLAPGVGSGGSPSATPRHGDDSWQQDGKRLPQSRFRNLFLRLTRRGRLAAQQIALAAGQNLLAA